VVITVALASVCGVSLLAAMPSVRRLLQHEPRELLSAGAGLTAIGRGRRGEQAAAT
jgi:hypothetical protein